MSRRKKEQLGILLLACMICFTDCRRDGQTQNATEDSEQLTEAPTDTLDIEIPIADEEEEEDEVGGGHFDMTFDDFLFAFTYNRRLQRERMVIPLPHIDINNNVTLMEEFDCDEEFSFLKADFYTILYANTEDIDRLKESDDSIVHVERIYLHERRVRSYEFQHRQQGWTFVSFRDSDYEQTGYADFLDFYAQFSQDSLFQQTSIAQPMRMIMVDPDDETSYVEGTIDADQWPIFAPEMPQDELTNIRKGQHYEPHRMVMQKSGVGNGMQEVFTFDHLGAKWRLISYEN